MTETGARLRVVASRDNATVKQLRRAFSHGELTPDGCLAIESVRTIEEAIRSGMRFKAAFFAASAGAAAGRILPQLGAHVDTVQLPDEVFRSAVGTESPQGVAALVALKRWRLDAIVRTTEALIVVLAGVQDPGNLGTILRSAEAFGAAGVLAGDGTVSLYNPKVVRAAAGSLFRLPAIEVGTAEAIAALKEAGLRVIASSSHNARAAKEADFSGPIALVIGNEGAGVPRPVLAQADEVVAVPHSPAVESLNAGVAASILLYEVARQRGARK